MIDKINYRQRSGGSIEISSSRMVYAVQCFIILSLAGGIISFNFIFEVNNIWVTVLSIVISIVLLYSGHNSFTSLISGRPFLIDKKRALIKSGSKTAAAFDEVECVEVTHGFDNQNNKIYSLFIKIKGKDAVFIGTDRDKNRVKKTGNLIGSVIDVEVKWIRKKR